MNRWKNYGLWVAIASFIPMLLQAFGVPVVSEEYKEIVNSFLGILVMAGILNNPSNGKGFKDK